MNKIRKFLNVKILLIIYYKISINTTFINDLTRFSVQLKRNIFLVVFSVVNNTPLQSMIHMFNCSNNIMIFIEYPP